MTLPNESSLQKLQFYVTTPYQCGYLPNQLAQSLIASPQYLVNAQVYSGLIQQGFRRSGKFAYRPHCENCRACTPVRLVLAHYVPTRSQQRAFKQHQQLYVKILPLGFQENHYTLYAQYQRIRHSEDDLQNILTNNDAEQYRQFLCHSNVESLMIEFSDAEGNIKIVSVVDVVEDGISAVYTFYDASERKNSYGTFAIVWLSEWTKTLQLPYLYLGYWIENSRKMAYKQLFKPLEKLMDGEWTDD
ncbi:MAG: arginyltransferase [Methylophilaceae bacterium 17-44-8]|jgi:arginine-tRNA-protein transferase|nr:MAG: arginyltransferase [Methylophilales bacterium 28-44-11]OYZ07839.1 MAG: arginyltransferase [Methylophilales bacterium 16-45-7]OZA04641.1 MAG: arginyltransferase [Methylophilaceae bacterium 17-44-8]